MKAREYEIVQNSALAAVAIWHFVDRYVRALGGQHGPTLLHALPVLPIVFHEESANALGRRRFDGGFYTALSENRGLFVGLQKRMEDMAPQTFRALSLAWSARLLDYDRVSKELHVIRRRRPAEVQNESAKRICATAQRLGHWFATIPPQELGQRLRLHF